MFAPLLSLIVASPLLSSAAAAAQTRHNTTTSATVGWVSDGDNSRSTITLLYNCLFTIFLCTWSAMHLNVPGQNDTSFHIFLRKCRWMLGGVLAPEYVALMALNEWYNARSFVVLVNFSCDVFLQTERKVTCSRNPIYPPSLMASSL